MNLWPVLIIFPDGRKYRLADPWSYTWEFEGIREIIVSRGFVTDLASVPRILWSLVAPQDLAQAAIVHDWLYRHQGLLPAYSYLVNGMPTEAQWSRHDVDRLFARIMRECGVAKWRRRMAYRTVRLFGLQAWNANRADPLPPTASTS